MPTKVSTRNGRQLVIRLGDGGSPEQFVHPCMINTSRGIEFGSTPIESTVPYCPPDELLPGWIEREIDALTATITGAGIFDTRSLDIFWDWFNSGLSKNIHVEILASLALEGGYWSMAAVLSSFSVSSGSAREKLTFDCTILSDGAPTWVNATS